jgi:endonuclease/exonuclease/phosphatase family metal-dependent hydrolase
MRVVTLNTMLLPLGIHLSNQTNKLERAGKIADWINESGADIVFLQEVFLPQALDVILDKCSAYESHSTRAFWLGSGLVTLSRIPIEERSEIQMSFRGGILPWYFSKPVQVTVLRGGIVVYNLHLTSANYYFNNDRHEYEVKRECEVLRKAILADQIKTGRSWIVGGDFNYDRPGFMPAQLKKSTIDPAYIMDLDRTPVVELDHVFSSGTVDSWEKFSCHSDHLGVKYEITL